MSPAGQLRRRSRRNPLAAGAKTATLEKVSERHAQTNVEQSRNSRPVDNLALQKPREFSAKIRDGGAVKGSRRDRGIHRADQYTADVQSLRRLVVVNVKLKAASLLSR